MSPRKTRDIVAFLISSNPFRRQKSWVHRAPNRLVKVLLDTCVWGKAKEELSAAGHDTEWAGDWERDTGDEEILRLGHEQERVLVTLDKDFGELAVAFGRPHSGLVRLVGMARCLAHSAFLSELGDYTFDYRRVAVANTDHRKVGGRSGGRTLQHCVAQGLR